MSVAAVGAARATAARSAGTAGRGARVGKPPAAASGGGPTSSTSAGGGRRAGGAAGGGSSSRPTSSSQRARSGFPTARAGSAVNQGAGFVLGLLAWGWVGLPFLRGGQAEVRDVLRAKFFNKGADGSWLP